MNVNEANRIAAAVKRGLRVVGRVDGTGTYWSVERVERGRVTCLVWQTRDYAAASRKCANYSENYSAVTL